MLLSTLDIVSMMRRPRNIDIPLHHRLMIGIPGQMHRITHDPSLEGVVTPDRVCPTSPQTPIPKSFIIIITIIIIILLKDLPGYMVIPPPPLPLLLEIGIWQVGVMLEDHPYLPDHRIYMSSIKVGRSLL
jgi:hypothetical protein